MTGSGSMGNQGSPQDAALAATPLGISFGRNMLRRPGRDASGAVQPSLLSVLGYYPVSSPLHLSFSITHCLVPGSNEILLTIETIEPLFQLLAEVEQNTQGQSYRNALASRSATMRLASRSPIAPSIARCARARDHSASERPLSLTVSRSPSSCFAVPPPRVQAAILVVHAAEYARKAKSYQSWYRHIRLVPDSGFTSQSDRPASTAGRELRLVVPANKPLEAED
ncbi:hypothetical protein BKA63DRAFT_487032 [Paraphoma chrysanthemicola]|nr:hypothetical protein BKA63DRAFT_487032 [Paraphoma chrysanthemicola]